MSLVASGEISLKNATTTRSIQYEVRCTTSGNASLSSLSSDAGKGAPHAMSEFYSFTMPLGTPSVDDPAPSCTCASTGQCKCTTNQATATCSTSPGGCVESYSWAYVSGDVFNITIPTSNKTAFASDWLVCNSPVFTGTYRCTMSRSGTSSQTVDVVPTAENTTKTGCL